MKLAHVAVAALIIALPPTLALVASPAVAQSDAKTATASPTVEAGDSLATSDGHRIGAVDKVEGGSAFVIYNGQYLAIPLSTVSAGARGFVTTMTRADLDKLSG